MAREIHFRGMRFRHELGEKVAGNVVLSFNSAQQTDSWAITRASAHGTVHVSKMKDPLGGYLIIYIFSMKAIVFPFVSTSSLVVVVDLFACSNEMNGSISINGETITFVDRIIKVRDPYIIIPLHH